MRHHERRQAVHQALAGKWPRRELEIALDSLDEEGPRRVLRGEPGGGGVSSYQGNPKNRRRRGARGRCRQADRGAGARGQTGWLRPSAGAQHQAYHTAAAPLGVRLDYDLGADRGPG